ncbi:hypothetical protein FMEXI_4492 [Fusarium mexicanum]|uniref:Uncharacterized protein n=1 Tax=Fusarium mexicanum TaxID=751941 RepID=A0A8H5J647_9HYPO|nr:hypothetical protein FMEXI_4492 [Fusarium mexicanum]
MSDEILFINKKREINLIRYLEKAKRQCIDHCRWTVTWQYAHGEGRASTTTGNKFPNYIAYQRTSDGEHRTRLAIKTKNVYYFLSADKGGEHITTEKCWGQEEPLMKDVLGAYQAQWGIPITNTRSEDEAE